MVKFGKLRNFDLIYLDIDKFYHCSDSTAVTSWMISLNRVWKFPDQILLPGRAQLSSSGPALRGLDLGSW